MTYRSVRRLFGRVTYFNPEYIVGGGCKKYPTYPETTYYFMVEEKKSLFQPILGHQTVRSKD